MASRSRLAHDSSQQSPRHVDSREQLRDSHPQYEAWSQGYHAASGGQQVHRPAEFTWQVGGDRQYVNGHLSSPSREPFAAEHRYDGFSRGASYIEKSHRGASAERSYVDQELRSSWDRRVRDLTASVTSLSRETSKRSLSPPPAEPTWPTWSDPSDRQAADAMRQSRDLTFRVPALPTSLDAVGRAFESIQTELLVQSRRHDDSQSRLAKTEADLSRITKLCAETEELYATERQQKHNSVTTLTRRTEDALVTCESLRNMQEQVIARWEKLEAVAQGCHRMVRETADLRQEVGQLHGTIREKLDVFSHAMRRVDALEQIFDENTKLRQEVNQLRKNNERRDLEMAGLQGQLDALTKLVRDRLPGESQGPTEVPPDNPPTFGT